MEKPLRIVLVESSFLIRSGLEKLFSELPGMLIVEMYDGSEKRMVENIYKQKPDVLIISPESVEPNLDKLINSFHSFEELTILGLVDSKTPDSIRSRFKNILDIRSEKFELLQQTKPLLKPLLSKEPFSTEDQLLSEREKNILKLVTLGLTSFEIADKLFLSIHTINTHRKNISKKLGIKTVSGLTVFAIMNQLVSLQEIEGK